MSFTEKVIKKYKKQTKEDVINKISVKPFDELKDISSFKNLKFADCYIYCKIIYSQFTDNNKNIINAKGNIISSELSPEKFNDGKDKIIPNHLPTFLPSFDYENHCKEAIYDLTDDEKLFLWEINGHLSNVLGLRIQELYKTTKIHLTTSNNVDKKNTYDRLGYYTKSTTPEVWLIMDLITGEAKRLQCNREYIVAMVYIHEMTHRYFDVRPDLTLKKYIVEIEEPMAEFATLKFCEEYCKEHGRKMFLPIALVMTDGLQYDDESYIYALGSKIFIQNISHELIASYRRVSTILHTKDNYEVDDSFYLLGGHPMQYLKNYIQKVKDCPKKDLENLVQPIQDCIHFYSLKFVIQSEND